MKKLAIIIFALLITAACADNTPPPAQPANNTTPTNSATAPTPAATPATGTTPVPGTSPAPGNAADAGKTITTPSGLQYIDIQEGTGASPQEGQIVSVHYTGTLTDGTKFDSSVDRGQPLNFPLGVGRVIKGWDEGILSMKVGGKRKLIIPPQLGYGAGGRGKIPPNATLLFDVELVGIQGGQQ